MNPLTAAALLYLVGVLIFLWFGLTQTTHDRRLVWLVSVLWLPFSIFAAWDHWRHSR